MLNGVENVKLECSNRVTRFAGTGGNRTHLPDLSVRNNGFEVRGDHQVPVHPQGLSRTTLITGHWVFMKYNIQQNYQISETRIMNFELLPGCSHDAMTLK